MGFTLHKEAPIFPNKLSKRWPATRLAARRTERVIGRITLLIVSIITINGIRNGGVPRGTRCAKNLCGAFIVLVVM